MLIEMRDVLTRLLTPQNTLNPLLFDEQNRLRSNIHNILSRQANYIYSLIIAEIKGLKVTDVYLTGSMASYFYSGKSEVDLRIVIENKDCPELAADSKFLSQFLQFYFFGSLHRRDFRLIGKKVNIKLSTDKPEKLPLGLYSIMHKKWLLAPQKNITAGLNADEIYAKYEQKYNEIEAYLLQLDNSGELETKAGIDKLVELYEFLVANCNNSITDYIIFKMLKYRGMIDNITATKNQALSDFLSLD